MIIIYGVILATFILALILTRNYKRKEREVLFEKHQIGDGLGLFLQEKCWFLDKYKDIFHQLCPDKEADLEKKKFQIRQISMSLIFGTCIIGFGFCQSIRLSLEKQKEITELMRPVENQGARIVDLMAKYGEEEAEEVQIVVEEYMLSNEEIEEKVEEAYQYISKNILGDNLNLEEIRYHLNFSVEEYQGIHIDYEPDEEGWIQRDGSINKGQLYEIIEKENPEYVDASVEVVFSYGEYIKIYTLDIRILVQDIFREENEQWKGMLSYQLKEENQKNQKKLSLPTEILGKEISFYEKKQNSGYFYFLLGIAVMFLYFYSKKNELSQGFKKRNQQMELDYAVIVNKLNLYTGAGASVSMAWNRMINDYEEHKEMYGYHYAYEEMKLVRKRIKNGISETEAYSEFGKRCNLNVYVKLGCLLEQNIKKGTKGLQEKLAQEVREAFMEKKALAKKRGEEASTKLLLPMMMMLIVSMVIVLMPALLSMGI